MLIDELFSIFDLRCVNLIFDIQSHDNLLLGGRMFLLFLTVFFLGATVTLYALNFKTVNTWIATNVMAIKEMWAKYRAKP